MTLCAAAAVAQDSAKTATPTIPTTWDVLAKHGPSRDVTFETSEGTWTSVDISPDGRTLVFDLLGDIYTMPITGGKAALLLGGPAYETMPRWSPDGTRIAFTSDRDGIENLWTVAVDGKDLRQVSKEKERQVSNPAWTPDGRYLVGRKHFRNTRSLGAGEMWIYHVSSGAVLAYLDKAGLAKNTMVIYTSDQGFFLGDHGLFDKRFIYEESIRMPFLVRWPAGIKPGTKSGAMALNIDFAPTFLEAAGLPMSADIQGRSLLSVLRGRTPAN